MAAHSALVVKGILIMLGVYMLMKILFLFGKSFGDSMKSRNEMDDSMDFDKRVEDSIKKMRDYQTVPSQPSAQAKSSENNIERSFQIYQALAQKEKGDWEKVLEILQSVRWGGGPNFSQWEKEIAEQWNFTAAHLKVSSVAAEVVKEGLLHSGRSPLRFKEVELLIKSRSILNLLWFASQPQNPEKKNFFLLAQKLSLDVEEVLLGFLLILGKKINTGDEEWHQLLDDLLANEGIFKGSQHLDKEKQKQVFAQILFEKGQSSSLTTPEQLQDQLKREAMKVKEILLIERLRSRKGVEEDLKMAFEDLGLTPLAKVSEEEVKSAYHSMAKKFHPDTALEEMTTKELEAKFRSVKESYDKIRSFLDEKKKMLAILADS